MRAVGHSVALTNDKPVIGILNSVSELNPCNLPLRHLAEAVKVGVERAGGIPVEMATISLGEDLMQPTAMLYRNLFDFLVPRNADQLHFVDPTIGRS